jgi:hypothetical protein
MQCGFNCKIFGYSGKNRVACALNDGLVAELVLPSNGVSAKVIDTMRTAHILSPEPMILVDPIIWCSESKVLTCNGIEFPHNTSKFNGVDSDDAMSL